MNKYIKRILKAQRKEARKLNMVRFYPWQIAYFEMIRKNTPKKFIQQYGRRSWFTFGPTVRVEPAQQFYVGVDFAYGEDECYVDGVPKGQSHIEIDRA